jgi:hypothetical protein
VFPGHDYLPNGRELRYETTIACEKSRNPQLNGTTTREQFVALRRARDAGLDAPQLLFQSVQVNIDGGRLPAGWCMQREAQADSCTRAKGTPGYATRVCPAMLER